MYQIVNHMVYESRTLTVLHVILFRKFNEKLSSTTLALIAAEAQSFDIENQVHQVTTLTRK